MKIVVLGAGQLGGAFARLGDNEIVVLGRSAIDLTDRDALIRVLDEHRPDLIINTAAYNKVDEAERCPELAFAINAVVPGNVARIATSIGARVVHVSTDYVFSGAADRPYLEDDLPSPLGVYGASKLAGEHLTIAYAPDALIVRTSGVFGVPPPNTKSSGNFVLAILRQAVQYADQGEGLRVVSDQIMNPTYADDLAAAILTLVRQGVTGTINVTNSGSCSRYEFALAIVASVGLAVPVVPTTSATYMSAARRPLYSVLSSTKLQAYGIVMPSWQDALARYVATTDAVQASVAQQVESSR